MKRCRKCGYKKRTASTPEQLERRLRRQRRAAKLWWSGLGFSDVGKRLRVSAGRARQITRWHFDAIIARCNYEDSCDELYDELQFESNSLVGEVFWRWRHTEVHWLGIVAARDAGARMSNARLAAQTAVNAVLKLLREELPRGIEMERMHREQNSFCGHDLRHHDRYVVLTPAWKDSTAERVTSYAALEKAMASAIDARRKNGGATLYDSAEKIEVKLPPAGDIRQPAEAAPQLPERYTPGIPFRLGDTWMVAGFPGDDVQVREFFRLHPEWPVTLFANDSATWPSEWSGRRYNMEWL